MDLIDFEKMNRFLNHHCLVPSGGFSKFPSVPLDDDSVHGPQEADLFHTFLSLASLALMNDQIDPATVIPRSGCV